MFIFTGNAKEGIVTTGVLIAGCILITLAIKCAFLGGYALIVSVIFILILSAIFKGIKLGYIVARLFFGGIAISLPTYALNPFFYEDTQIYNMPYEDYLLGFFLIIALAVFLFYCLGEHSRLRTLRQT
jgi:hypothetical protein